MTEEWHYINGFDDAYQISNMGRARSIKLGVVKIKKLTKTKTGYLHARFSKSGKAFYLYIHRLVAEHFIPRVSDRLEVNHKSGIKADNRVENLEWCDRSENSYHAQYIGSRPIGEQHTWAKLSDEEAMYIFNSTESHDYLANKFGVGRTAIRRIKNKSRRQWMHIKKHVSLMSVSTLGTLMAATASKAP